MARMVRKQIVIDADREALLSRIAGERGTSQSEVIRMAIDALVRDLEQAQLAAERKAERDRIFEDLLESFATAGNLGLTDESGKRTWTRAGLYERRGTR